MYNQVNGTFIKDLISVLINITVTKYLCFMELISEKNNEFYEYFGLDLFKELKYCIKNVDNISKILMCIKLLILLQAYILLVDVILNKFIPV